jgi:hypothetical protein
MAETAPARVTCPTCGSAYRWAAELVGRKFACKCGAVLRMPADASRPATVERGATTRAAAAKAPASTEAGTIPLGPSLAASGRCPSCGLNVKTGAVICLNCGFSLTQGKKLTTAVVEDADDADAEPGAAASPGAKPRAARTLTDGTKSLEDRIARQREERAVLDAQQMASYRFMEFKLPLILMAVGLLVVFGGGVYFSGSPLWGVVIGAALLGFELIVMLPLLLIAVFMAAKVGGISYGSLWTALLKLASICTGPGAVADVVLMIILPFFALNLFAVFGIVFSVYMIFLGPPLSKMFDLDMNETIVTVGAVIVVRGMILVFGLMALMSMLV